MTLTEAAGNGCAAPHLVQGEADGDVAPALAADKVTGLCALAAARSVGGVAVDRSWRSADRCWLVDEVVDEPGVQFRVWDAEGAPVADAVGPAELHQVLERLGVDQDGLERVPVTDPWCE